MKSIYKILLCGLVFQSSCNKEKTADSQAAKEEKKTGVVCEALPIGVLPSSFTEDKVFQFHEKYKGRSIDEIIDILGLPFDKWEHKGTVFMKYVINDRYNNIDVGIDFSGFVLNFKDGKLKMLGNRYGLIFK